MWTARQGRLLALGVLSLAGIALAGCSSQIADLQSVGSTDSSSRVKEVGTYLPVHDLPPERGEAVISPEQRAKIQAELVAAREHQASASKEAAEKDAPK